MSRSGHTEMVFVGNKHLDRNLGHGSLGLRWSIFSSKDKVSWILSLITDNYGKCFSDETISDIGRWTACVLCDYRGYGVGSQLLFDTSRSGSDWKGKSSVLFQADCFAVDYELVAWVWGCCLQLDYARPLWAFVWDWNQHVSKFNRYTAFAKCQRLFKRSQIVLSPGSSWGYRYVDIYHPSHCYNDARPLWIIFQKWRASATDQNRSWKTPDWIKNQSIWKSASRVLRRIVFWREQVSINFRSHKMTQTFLLFFISLFYVFVQKKLS